MKNNQEIEPTKYECTGCEIIWEYVDCNRGKMGGQWFAHCPNCRMKIFPPKKEVEKKS